MVSRGKRGFDDEASAVEVDEEWQLFTGGGGGFLREEYADGEVVLRGEECVFGNDAVFGG